MTEGNQKQAIRKALEAGRTLTPREALNEFGCMRLAARIKDLRKEGMDIETVLEDGFGNYRLRSIIDDTIDQVEEDEAALVDFMKDAHIDEEMFDSLKDQVSEEYDSYFADDDD